MSPEEAPPHTGRPPPLLSSPLLSAAPLAAPGSAGRSASGPTSAAWGRWAAALRRSPPGRASQSGGGAAVARGGGIKAGTGRTGPGVPSRGRPRGWCGGWRPFGGTEHEMVELSILGEAGMVRTWLSRRPFLTQMFLCVLSQIESPCIKLFFI